MIEKTVDLEGVSLVDFFGAENQNINQISDAFPSCKILARGSAIHLKGAPAEVLRINDIINSVLAHYHKYGSLTNENMSSYIKDEVFSHFAEKDDTIIYGAKGNPIKPQNQSQKKITEAVAKHDMVFAIGPAGTGKTYIAVALAVRALKNKEVKRIIVTRPAVEAGENLGFLPGDLQEKLDPYLRPIYDALFDMVPAEKLKYYQENKIIEIAPLAYMRGRTLANSFILLDEAQNTTPMQMKMFLTRMGLHSKMIITGDESQIDLPKNQKSGLVEAATILRDVQGIGIVHLDSSDVVRHKLVGRIINAYQANS